MNENIFEISTEGMCALLEVKSIKQIIRRGTLEERLLQKNIKLIDKIRKGKKTFFLITNLTEKTFDELCKKHKIRKIEKFSQHTRNRYYSINGMNELVTQRQFANKINEDVRNIRKYDEVLLEEKFMKKDGFRYWVYKDGKMLYETSKESYNKYWANNRAEKQLINILKEKLNKKEITLEEYSDMYSNIISKLNVKGEIIQRTRNFAKGSEFEKIFNMMNQ